MNVKTRERIFTFGAHEVIVACRALPQPDGAVDPDDGDINENATSVDSVGWDIWEAATDTLCRFLASNPSILTHRRVLELGSGVGVVSILAAKLGSAFVTCTDYDDIVLQMASTNAQLNKVTEICTVAKFDWDDEAASMLLAGRDQLDLLLGSDLMYSSSCARKLRKAVTSILSRNADSMMILSHEIRHSVTWGTDMTGAKQPIVEDCDSVLESFLDSCIPIDHATDDRKFEDHPHKDNRLFACSIPYGIEPGERTKEDNSSHSEMHSAAEVEMMTLTLMQAAAAQGKITPSSDEGDTENRGTCSESKESTDRNPSKSCWVDTSHSGKVLVFAFSSNPNVLRSFLATYSPVDR